MRLGFYPSRGRKFPNGNFRTSVFGQSRTPLSEKRKLFDRVKKIPFQKERGFLHISELALRNCAYRACASAGTTIYTSVCVDLVLAVALSDSANRALARARAAHNAAATDNICHWYCTSKCILQIYCTTCSEKSNKNRWLVFGNFYHSTQFGSVYEKSRKIVIQSDIARKLTVSLIYLTLIVRNGQIFLLILDASGYTI